MIVLGPNPSATRRCEGTKVPDTSREAAGEVSAFRLTQAMWEPGSPVTAGAAGEPCSVVHCGLGYGECAVNTVDWLEPYARGKN